MFYLISMLQAADSQPVVPVRYLDRPLTIGSKVVRTDVAGSVDSVTTDPEVALDLGVAMGIGRFFEAGITGLPVASDMNLAMITPEFYARTGFTTGPLSFAPSVGIRTSWPLIPDQLTTGVATCWALHRNVAMEVAPTVAWSLHGGGARELTMPIHIWFQASNHLYAEVGSDVIFEGIGGSTTVTIPASAGLGLSLGRDGNAIGDLVVRAGLPEALQETAGGWHRSTAWNLQFQATAYFDPRIRGQVN